MFDEDLTYRPWETASETPLSDIVPDLPEDYFDGKEDAFGPNVRKRPSLFPYIRGRNLNRGPNGEHPDGKSRYAVEIGVGGSF